MELHMEVKKVAILGGARTPFVRSMAQYMGKTNQDLATKALSCLVDNYNLHGKKLGEVAIGAVIKHARDWNLARETSLGSGLSPETPAYDVIQACGTSLESAICVGNKIALGQIEVGVAGGTETHSDSPVVYGPKFQKTLIQSSVAKSTMDKIKPFLSLRPKDLKPMLPGVVEPRTKLSMGQSCELMAQHWQVSRQEQDQLAYESHLKASKAYEQNFYSDMLCDYMGVDKDTIVRPSTTLEKLAKLRTAFEKSEKGTLTAGNSTALTDGAAMVLLSSEDWARKNDIPVLAYMTFVQTAAVDFVNEEGLLMAPAYAVSELLKQAQLTLQDFDFYEIHEAFAAQVLCTLKAWESEEFCKNKLGREKALGSIDRSKLNIKGGSVALGHPFGATGARILMGLAKILDENGGGRGLISICTGGGMGVTAILEK